MANQYTGRNYTERVAAFVDKQTKEALERASKRSGKPQAHYVRVGLHMALKADFPDIMGEKPRVIRSAHVPREHFLSVMARMIQEKNGPVYSRELAEELGMDRDDCYDRLYEMSREDDPPVVNVGKKQVMEKAVSKYGKEFERPFTYAHWTLTT